MPGQISFETVVVGAGPAGLATGLAMAGNGLSVGVVGPRASPHDGRTAALFQGSIEFLRRLGVWNAVQPHAEPIAAIRLADATSRLFRAPEVTFHACEIGLEAFGWNVPVHVLTRALETAFATQGTRIQTAGIVDLKVMDGNARLLTREGETLACRLVAAADGRNSMCRQAAGIATTAWAYDQSAIVCTFSHSRPHNQISTELHGESGPLTVVPMPGNASSLVWVERVAEAERLANLDDAAFQTALSRQIGPLLGSISAIGRRGMFPLSGMTATSFGQNRTALIGETAHVIPPIGAQGLNLSFRDAATLAELAGAAQAAGKDIGGPAVLRDYEHLRRPDATSRVWTIDLLNRSLLSGFLPVHLTRGAGLAALRAIAPLRHFVMREGISPSRATLVLMRPRDALPAEGQGRA